MHSSPSRSRLSLRRLAAIRPRSDWNPMKLQSQSWPRLRSWFGRNLAVIERHRRPLGFRGWAIVQSSSTLKILADDQPPKSRALTGATLIFWAPLPCASMPYATNRRPKSSSSTMIETIAKALNPRDADAIPSRAGLRLESRRIKSAIESRYDQNSTMVGPNRDQILVHYPITRNAQCHPARASLLIGVPLSFGCEL